MAIGTISNLDTVILLCERMTATRAFCLNVMKFPLEIGPAELGQLSCGRQVVDVEAAGAGGCLA